MALVHRGAALVQPLASGRPAGRARYYRRRGGALSVALSADGRSLAVATREGIEIVDVARMRIRSFLIESATTEAPPQFSPDGRVLAAGSREGWVRFWSTRTLEAGLGQARRPPRRRALALDQPGRTHAGLGRHGRHTPPLRHRDPPAARGAAARRAALRRRRRCSRPTARTCSPSPPPRGVRWDLRASTWKRHACKVAGRTLTRSEWTDALRGRDYTPACRR